MSKEGVERGNKIRREVLGDQYVDKADKNLDDFIRPFREYVAEYVWAEVWDRPGLDRRTRIMLNIAMLTALGKLEELKLYLQVVARSPNLGVSKEDVREVLMHTAPYCGIPSTLGAFRVAQECLADMPSGTPSNKA
jgi:4-carboxymuconolactone decarboxylase